MDGWTDRLIHMPHRALLEDYRLSCVSLHACLLRYQPPPPLSPGQSNYTRTQADDSSWEMYSHSLPVLSADPSFSPSVALFVPETARSTEGPTLHGGHPRSLTCLEGRGTTSPAQVPYSAPSSRGVWTLTHPFLSPVIQVREKRMRITSQMTREDTSLNPSIQPVLSSPSL